MYSKYVSQELNSEPTILIGGKASWLMESLIFEINNRGYRTVLVGKDQDFLSSLQDLYIDRAVLVVGDESSGYVKKFFTLIRMLKKMSGNFPVDIVLAEDFASFLEKKEKIGKYYSLLQILRKQSKLLVLEPNRGVAWKDVVSQGGGVSKKIVEALFNTRLEEVVYVKIDKKLPTNALLLEKKLHSENVDKKVIKNKGLYVLEKPLKQIEADVEREEEEREKNIMSLFSEVLVEKEKQIEKNIPLLNVENVRKRKVPKVINKKMIEILGIVFSFFGVFLISMFFFIFFNVLSVKNSFKALESSIQEKRFGDAKIALNDFSNANSRLRFVYEKTGQIVMLLVGEERFNDLGRILNLNNVASNVLISTLDMSSSLTNMYEKIMSSSGGGIEILEENKWKVEEAYKKLSIYLSEASNAKTVSLFSYNKKIDAYKNSALTLQRQLVGIQQLSQVFPELMGKDKKMTYLVLVQNSNELRPTGGFLQSLVFVTFQKGELLDYQTLDVLTTDTLLNGQVESPKDLKDTLGGTSWYLRDSNWSGDFEESAKQATWFVEKELGRTVDGVVGINTQMYPKLLSALGKISIPEYEEELTEKNVLERISLHNDLGIVNKENGGKKDFLTLLTKSLFQSIVEASGPKVESMGVVLMEGLRKNEIFVYMNNPELQRIFMSLGWSGTIVSPPCPQQFFQQNCYVDRMFSVESNVGVNKINPYIERSAKHDVVLDGQNAIHIHTLSLKNTAESNTWPLGTYKNYQRLYLPQPAQINSVLIDGNPVEKSKLYFTNTGTHEVVGVYIEVPIKKTTTVTISYVVPLVKKNESVFSYAFFIQKQAGISEIPTRLSVSVKKPGLFEKIAPTGKVVGQKVEFEDLLQTSFFVATQVKGL